MSLASRSYQCFVITIFGLSAFSAYSEPLTSAINIETATNTAAVNSQKKIDSLSGKTQKMLDEYRSTTHQIETLTTLNSPVF